jgi:hypothetical protein
LAHYVRLYQGPDHFLQVFSTGFTETYKRFYFRDVQAILVARKWWHHAWSVFWLMLAAFFGAIEYAAGGTVVLLILAGLCIAALVINIVIGPSCLCYIRTAVQTEKLPSFKRLRSARKFIARMRPVLESAQAEPATAPETAATPETATPSEPQPGV